MTDRTITLTPTEAEKFQALAVGESMWLVRAGVHQHVGMAMPCQDAACRWATPPAEFVQACAPCETCHDTTASNQQHGEFTRWDPLTCPDCRIELVGAKWEAYPVHECGSSPVACLDRESAKATARRLSSVIFPWSVRPATLGCAYATGEPLLLTAENIGHHYYRLAHYGPPESLPGQWAIEVRKA